MRHFLPHLRWLAFAALLAAIPALPQPQPPSGDIALNSPSGVLVETTTSAPAATARLQYTPEQVGDAHFVSGRYQAALGEYKKVSAPSASVWNKMGISYEMLFDLKDAARCYKEAIKIDPQNAQLLNNLATIEDAMMDFAAGEKNYRKALKIDPNSAMILKNLGTNLFMQYRNAEGAELYRQALALDPHVFEAHDGPASAQNAPRGERGAEAYYKARSCARADQDDCALTFLRQSFNEGYATTRKVKQDEDFARLRTTAAYVKLVAVEP
jgi:tetratricopeptide (TPR) repeat protein